MKKITLFFLSLFVTITGFTENFVFDNQTAYPNKDQKSRIAVQWANSEKEVEKSNQAIIYGSTPNPDTLQTLTQIGKITLNIPKNAQHFRVLVWSKDEAEPDLLTNWVDIVPNKTYTLTTDHLIPTVLMSGIGC